jgi:hypothetical protein
MPIKLPSVRGLSWIFDALDVALINRLNIHSWCTRNLIIIFRDYSLD